MMMNCISPLEVSKNPETYFILDIREPYEYEFVNIQTINIPMSEVCQRLQELPKDKTIVLMCQSGNRASALGNLLEVEFCITNILVMEGGIKAWKEQVDHTLKID
jgi:rhodanese-related sulfurtransferase